MFSIFFCALFASVPDAEWSSFRGIGNDVSAIRDLPLSWSDDEGIAWQAPLNGYGQSSPVVYGRKVFVTSVDGPEKERGITSCFDLKTGARQWSAEVPASQNVPSSDMVSRGAPTPCVDARAVYVFFESGDVAAFTHDGRRLWHRKLAVEYGKYQGNHGLGGSLAQSAVAIYLLVDHDGPSYLLALDKATGKNLWKTERSSRTSWSSPLFVDGPQPFVVISSSGSVEAYDADTGKPLWSLPGVEGNTVASPTTASDLLIIGSSDPGQTLALRKPAGDSATPEIVWRLKSLSASFSSPLAYQGHVYVVNKSGVAACIDAESGGTLWSERLPGSCWATAVGALNRIYFFGKDGVTTVVSSGSRFERLAENRLSIDEGRVYGAAAVPGALVLRTGKKLICVGKP